MRRDWSIEFRVLFSRIKPHISDIVTMTNEQAAEFIDFTGSILRIELTSEQSAMLPLVRDFTQVHLPDKGLTAAITELQEYKREAAWNA